MTLSPEIQDGIKTHLWEVAAHLHAVAAETRADILHDVESHIHEALAERSPMPTLDDFHAVLAEMPLPASYAPGRDTAKWTAGNRGLTWNEVPGALVNAGQRLIDWLRQYTWESVIGVILLILGLPMLLRGWLLMRFGTLLPLSGESVAIIGFLLLALGIIAMVLAWRIGGIGMQRIRKSDWHLHGFVGAYVAYITPQVLLLTYLTSAFLLFFVPVYCEHIVGMGLDNARIFTMMIILFVAGSLNYFLIKYRWIALHHGAPEQATGEVGRNSFRANSSV